MARACAAASRITLAAFFLLVLLFLAGCAGEKKAVIETPPPPKPAPTLAAIGPGGSFCLLRQPNGNVGSVVVTNAKGTVTLSKANEAVEVKGPGESPSAPVTLSDEEVAKRYGAALSALPPPPAHFILYFMKDKPELTEESKPLVEQIAEAIRARMGADISIVGHTDSTGDATRNFKLGLQRAKTMADLLTAKGLDLTAAQVASHGQDNPLVPTGPGVDEPKNRRVEITVR